MASSSAPVALGLGGIATVLLVSGLQGKSIAAIFKGDFGSPHDPAFAGNAAAGGEGLSTPTKGTNEPAIGNIPAGLISPFPKSSTVKWGRSDQGVDGVTNPGSPMLAMADGEVTWAHNAPGFGANYPVLKTSHGSYYYGHSVPAVPSGTKVKKGQVIAHANTNGQGNATTPGAFEIGTWPPGNFSTAGAAIRNWFIALPRV